MRTKLRKTWLAAFAGAMMATGLAAAPAAAQTSPEARPQRPVTIETRGERHAGEFMVPLNKSQVLRLERPFTDLTVGNPAIADVLPLTNQTIYVLGKTIGSTNMLIYGPNRQLIAVVDLVVTPDIAGLRARLHEIMPSERIEVRHAGGSVVLSGTISSAIAQSKALAIAQRYIGAEQADRGIANLMQVRGSQQVMLAVRFAEVSRSVVKDLGLNLGVFFTRGRTTTAFASGNNPALLNSAGTNVVPLGAAFSGGTLARLAGSLSISAAFDALEDKGLVKTLAEPNLIALSGDSASFLAGGEFPIPVAQSGATASGSAAITVEFKQFGVSLAFTPTVIDENRINLVVAPEVSQLDFTRTITSQSITVPSLTVRRAQTTIELGNGQSFAIAGLLQNTFTDQINQVPWIGDVPVLGLLFRSSNYQRNESELVIVVTPYIVKPSSPDAIITPADRFVPPSENDLFLLGRIAGRLPTATLPPEKGGSTSLRASGGITGPYGYVIK